jgi:hypothetical protein
MSEQAKHTPGVWGTAHRKNADGMFSTEVFCEKGETIATLAWYPKNEGSGVTSTYREANARLIAAAPDLLAALQDLLSDESPMWAWVNERGIGKEEYALRSGRIDRARAAITRASLPA